MKKILLTIAIVLTGCSGNSKNHVDIEYRLSYDAADPHIHVSMKCQPTADSLTFVFGNPEFGGQTDIYNCFQHLQVNGAAFKHDETSRTVTVYPNGKSLMHLEYDVVDDGSKGQFQRELFRPVLKHDYLYAPTLSLFLIPRDYKTTVSVTWEENEPFGIFSYFDPNLKEGNTFYGTIADLGMSLCVGGSGVSMQTCKAGNADGYLITQLDEDRRFNQQIIKDFFVNYFVTIRDFWQDDAPEDYSLAVLPFLEEGITHAVGGIGYEKGFCAKYFVQSDTVLNETNMFTIAHEIGHHWLGGSLSLGIEHQWFMEGFNDYQTYCNLRRCGIMSEDWYKRRFNQLFKDYYTSEISTLPNDKVWENYWTMGDYNKLPYRRGCLFAFFLDGQIQQASSGQKGFRELMIALKRTSENQKQLNLDDFIHVLSSFIPENAARGYIKDYIIDGQMIDFSDCPLPNNAKIVYQGQVPMME